MITAQVIVFFAVAATGLLFALANLPSISNDAREVFDLAYHLLVAA